MSKRTSIVVGLAVAIIVVVAIVLWRHEPAAAPSGFEAEVQEIGEVTTMAQTPMLVAGEDGWSTYVNTDYHYQIEVPTDWVGSEYSMSTDGKATTAAFDPEYVATADEYHTFDLSPGAATLIVTDSWGVKDATTIGVDGIRATYLSERVEEDGPNPWWWNKTRRTYQVGIPSAPGRVLWIDFNYDNALENDAEYQAVLQHMLDSFEFVE